MCDSFKILKYKNITLNWNTKSTFVNLKTRKDLLIALNCNREVEMTEEAMPSSLVSAFIRTSTPFLKLTCKGTIDNFDMIFLGEGAESNFGSLSYNYNR